MNPIRPETDITRILLVDDEADEAPLIIQTLQQLHLAHAVSCAKNVDELFTTLALPPLPHLIFLDINMPGINGLTGLRQLKAHATYAHLPVLMYSVSKSEKDIDEAFEAGAHYYMVKPYSAANLHRSLTIALAPDWRQPQPRPQRTSFVINEAFI
jgi:CheY-like chemotaxis protein